jgi:surface antigen
VAADRVAAVTRRALQAESMTLITVAEGAAIDPIRRFAAVALTGLLLAGAALAAGPMSWLTDTAFAKFDDKDTQLFKAALDKALDSPADGTPVQWNNERSGSSGTVTPERRVAQGGASCRDLRIANRHKDLAGEGVYRFCRTSAGKWSLVQ